MHQVAPRSEPVAQVPNSSLGRPRRRAMSSNVILVHVSSDMTCQSYHRGWSTGSRRGACALPPQEREAEHGETRERETEARVDGQHAGPERSSFLTKCQKYAATVCEAPATEKKLQGAAQASFANEMREGRSGAVSPRTVSSSARPRTRPVWPSRRALVTRQCSALRRRTSPALGSG